MVKAARKTAKTAKPAKYAPKNYGAYLTYYFTDYDPVIEQVRSIVRESGMDYQTIHARCGVSVQTLKAWFGGKTHRPRYATVQAVTRACGYKDCFIKEGAPKTLLVVK